jgi:hypothetical protein
MDKKQSGRRWRRRPNQKSSRTFKNTRDSQNKQSDWNSIADCTSRLGAAVLTDCDWFDNHMGRCFHPRNATLVEFEIGLSCGWVVVARSRVGPVRMGVMLAGLARHDASKHDTEEKARELFDYVSMRHTAENTDAALLALLEEIGRGASWLH